MDIILFILKSFVGLGFYLLAKVILPAITFGKIKAGDWSAEGFLGYPLYERKDGVLYLGSDFATFAGALIFVFFILVLVILF